VLRGLLPPVMGSMLEFGPVGRPVRLRLYVSGDTLVYDGLDEIARRFPVADLAVLHLGGTRLPGGFVVTMDGAQGAELARHLDPRRILPVHYGDYTVMRSPLSAFLAETESLGLGDRLVHCRHGERARISPAPGAAPTIFRIGRSSESDGLPNRTVFRTGRSRRTAPRPTTVRPAGLQSVGRRRAMTSWSLSSRAPRQHNRTGVRAVPC
jgi:hypothetical protein